MVPPRGLEPLAYGLGIRRSIHLSYGGIVRLCNKLLADLKITIIADFCKKIVGDWL
jgi:hypothetical protein